MSRGLTSTITDELAKGQFRMAHLVSLELSSTLLFTDAPVDIMPENTSTFRYMANFTNGSTTASTDGAYGLAEILFEQLIAGMTITSPFTFPTGLSIQSLGTAPNFTLNNAFTGSTGLHLAYFTGAPTYKANGFLLGLDGVQENSNINTGSLTIGISAVNQALVSELLNNNYLNKKVTIKRIFLDSNYVPVGYGSSYTPWMFSVYSGRIEGMNIKESGDESVMELSIANHWADFNRDNGRQTNTTSQQHWFPDDLSMEFAPQTGKKLHWGEITSDAPTMQVTRSTRRGL